MKKVSSLAIFSVMLGALVWGCSPEKRVEILSFFFDGVTRPGDARGGADAAGRKREGGHQTEVERYEHSPFAARQCESCHVRGSNNLVMPAERLCFNCHSVDLSKKYVHGPVAAGGCTVCHNPHGSGKRFLLVSDPRDFCLYCHDKAAVFAREVHEGVSEQCTACHDAHSSDNEFLLK